MRYLDENQHFIHKMDSHPKCLQTFLRARFGGYERISDSAFSFTDSIYN